MCIWAGCSSILLVAAAGNSGDGNISTDDVQYPAKFDSVIAVSAIDSNNVAPAWSADGSEVELAAPGVGIYSTWLGGGYTTSKRHINGATVRQRGGCVDYAKQCVDITK